MKIMDIHSHILPAVDDGARSADVSVKLLEMMKEQGITHVIATPHFDASVHNIEDFNDVVAASKKELDEATKGMELPKVILGSEVYYFSGIGKSQGVKQLSLGGSKYILLELQNAPIEKSVIDDITSLNYNIGLTPIIAHIERYAGEKGFKELLKLINNGTAYAQVNAQSVIDAPFKRIAQKLIKKGYISFIATDSHSVETRPPYMKQALDYISKAFGRSYMHAFVDNSARLCEEIIGE